MEGGHGYGTFDGRRYSAQTVLHTSLCAGAYRHRARCPAGPFLPAPWRGHEAAGRPVYQVDQDAHRADHLLHHRAWHRQHGGYEEGRPRRTEGALIYFEVLTSVALIVGLIVVNILQPGVGMNVDARTIDTKSIQVYTTKSGQQGTVEFLMHIIPNTVVGAFAEGEILQVLFFAILFAFGLFMLGERGRPVLAVIDITSHALFAVVGI